MASLFLSTIAFFVAAFFLRRYLDSIDIPRTFTRGVVVFVAAALIAYGVAFLVDAIAG